MLGKAKKSIADKLRDILDFEINQASKKGWRCVPIVTSIKNKAESKNKLFSRMKKKVENKIVPFSMKKTYKRSVTKPILKKSSSFDIKKSKRERNMMNLKISSFDSFNEGRSNRSGRKSTMFSFSPVRAVKRIPVYNMSQEGSSHYGGLKIFQKAYGNTFKMKPKPTNRNKFSFYEMDQKVAQLCAEEVKVEKKCNEIILELGSQSKQLHQDMSKSKKKCDLTLLKQALDIGRKSFHSKIQYLDNSKHYNNLSKNLDESSICSFSNSFNKIGRNRKESDFERNPSLSLEDTDAFLNRSTQSRVSQSVRSVVPKTTRIPNPTPSFQKDFHVKGKNFISQLEQFLKMRRSPLISRRSLRGKYA